MRSEERSTITVSSSFEILQSSDGFSGMTVTPTRQTGHVSVKTQYKMMDCETNWFNQREQSKHFSACIFYTVDNSCTVMRLSTIDIFGKYLHGLLQPSGQRGLFISTTLYINKAPSAFIFFKHVRKVLGPWPLTHL